MLEEGTREVNLASPICIAGLAEEMLGGSPCSLPEREVNHCEHDCTHPYHYPSLCIHLAEHGLIAPCQCCGTLLDWTEVVHTEDPCGGIVCDCGRLSIPRHAKKGGTYHS